MFTGITEEKGKIQAIGNNYNAVQMALMAMDRVFELLDATPKIVNKKGAIKLKGIKKGIKQGASNEKKSIAKSMLAKKMDIPLISEITGLSKKQIARLI